MIGIFDNVLGADDGSYVNNDCELPSYWVKIEGDSIHIVTDPSKLRYENITRNIYFSSTSFPYTDKFDITKSSVFDGWSVLPSSVS